MMKSCKRSWGAVTLLVAGCVAGTPLGGCASGGDFDAGKVIEGVAGVAAVAGFVALLALEGKNGQVTSHSEECRDYSPYSQRELLGRCNRNGW